MEPSHTLDDHIRLLQRKGYTEKGLDMPVPVGKIAETLREAYLDVAAEAAKTGNTMAFTMTLPARFDAKQDPVEFRMNFRYYPAEDKLQITAVSARMGHVRKLALLGASEKIDHAQLIYHDLCNKRTQKALEILSSRKIKPIKLFKHL